MSSTENLNTSRPVTARYGVVFLFAVVCAIGVLAAAALSQRSADAGPVVVTDQPAPISANVRRVAYSDAFTIAEAFTGLAAARRESALGFETGGRVASVSADTGDRVVKGVELARLDTRALEAQLAAANAQIAEAQASEALAQVTVARQKTLVEKGHVSSQVYDEAAAGAAAAAARIEAARASADTLRVQIDLARLTAPYDGVITARMVDEGAVASPGSPILSLVEAGAVEARIGLPSDLAADLKPGASYPLTVQGRDYSAVFRASTGVVDAADRTVSAVFDFAGDAPSPGAVVRLKLDQTIRERGFWAPLTALTEADRGLWAIYTVEADQSGEDRIGRKLVELIHAEADRAYVRGAVENDALFVVDGLQRLAPGAAVRAVLAGA